MQHVKKEDTRQVEYLGRWVSKQHFRAFVFNRTGGQKLANSWDEFQKLMATGLWSARKEDIEQLAENMPPLPPEEYKPPIPGS